RVLVPGYPQVLEHCPSLCVIASFPAEAALPSCSLARVTAADGLAIYVLLCPSLYERGGTPYADADRHDWHDNDLRFARLSLAAAEMAAGAGDPDWRPDVLHLNDWPTALAAGYATWRGLGTPSVLTIHNLAYQGLFAAERAAALGIPGRPATSRA